MKFLEAWAEFSKWHTKVCKTDSVTALNTGCQPRINPMVAEVQCNLCKEIFYIKYEPHDESTNCS